MILAYKNLKGNSQYLIFEPQITYSTNAILGYANSGETLHIPFPSPTPQLTLT